ncbi:hypothetical protein FACS1894153_2980 [Bacteroidia bacterium]|nr:hypothetical protein FACS1894153_2980 [Bacteroidia bacterium]
MKRFLFTLLSFSLTFLSFNLFSQNNGFNLDVKIKNYPADSILKLGRYYQAKQYFVENFTYNKKKDVWQIQMDTKLEPGMYMLISYENVPFEIIIDKNQNFSIELDYPFSFNVKYVNSPENQVSLNYNEEIRPLYKKFEGLRVKYDSITDKTAPESEEIIKQIQETLKAIEDAKTSFMANNPDNLMTAVFRSQKDVEVPLAPETITDEREKSEWRYNYYINHYFDNINLQDDRLIRTPMYDQRLKNYIEKVLPPHPDSIKYALERVIEKTRGCDELFKYTVWYAVDYYQRSQIIGYDAIWVYLAKKYYLPHNPKDSIGDAFWVTPSIVKNFQNRIVKLEPLLIGNIPPEFYCPDTNADTPKENFISVFKPAEKRRYTVVIFWEPSCGHCRKAMPVLRDLYDAKKDSLNFEVYAVCKDHNVDSWKNYIRSNNMLNWVNVNGKASNIKYDDLWDVYTTPTVYVLDDKHRIVTKRIEIDQIELFIKNWNHERYGE